MSGNELLKIEDVVQLLGLSRSQLAQLRYLGRGPAYLALTPRAIRYRLSDIDEWIEATVHRPKATA